MQDRDEDYYFTEDSKFYRKERKRLSKKDGSKYKKTDRDKVTSDEDLYKCIDKEGFMRGRILSIMPQNIIVEVEGKEYHCVMKGLLKKENRQLKNIVTVGDFVLIEEISNGEAIIVHVEPRKSCLSRADNITRRKEQLIAANVDQVLITVSVIDPVLRPAIIDRYIISTWKGNMEPVILVNKIDLLEQAEVEDIRFYNEFLKAYNLKGVKIIPISVSSGEGVEELSAVMNNKVSVFAGHSGVGKTSLINIVTGLQLAVGDTVAITKKGSHTTTRSQLIKLENGGWCVDTPGIKSFGVWDLEKRELSEYFPDIWEYGKKCRFQDCMHISELGCEVKLALDSGKISQIRYNSYLSLLEELDEKYLRR